MKGHREERGGRKYPVWNRVNVIAWARETMVGEACQSLADTNAFKGRGTAQTLRQLVIEVDTVEASMTELSVITRKVPGLQIYLAEHRRSSDGYMALRWRGVGSRKHVSWEDAMAIYSCLPSAVRHWYEQANERALELNARHLRLRKATREVRQEVQRRQTHVFAKVIPVRGMSMA
ncbi:hypothetical protein G7048_23710 [Diaphorobacter sp. HDW4B]|uniref:hypothetical protein n=1 Tax=Diaphorobacter sp. HDW4B TaxID=2714925 RepID=UPI00140CE6BA|nr:hypothetical protein [Diaphorobacter sp. HDW4B]QIL73094.1 hypothetical protein G7048_23710 [Diaphorobacter sp. HDW4B]